MIQSTDPIRSTTRQISPHLAQASTEVGLVGGPHHDCNATLRHATPIPRNNPHLLHLHLPTVAPHRSLPASARRCPGCSTRHPLPTRATLIQTPEQSPTPPQLGLPPHCLSLLSPLHRLPSGSCTTPTQPQKHTAHATQPPPPPLLRCRNALSSSTRHHHHHHHLNAPFLSLSLPLSQPPCLAADPLPDMTGT